MRQRWKALAVLLAALALFLPAVKYSFVSDDYDLIVNNPRLTSWAAVPGYFQEHLFGNIPVFGNVPRGMQIYFRPLHLLAFRLMYALLGPPSGIWHLAPILIHLAATACVFLLVRRLTRHDYAALLAMALFAVHPIQTEAVAWVSCVCDPLMTTFVILSVYFHVTRKVPVSLLALLFATLAIFTKEPGIVVPALIFAYEWAHSHLKAAAVAALPYLAPALLYIVLRVHALEHLSTQTSPSMSVGDMVLTSPRLLALYARNFLFPVKLGFSYDIFIERRVWPLLVLVAVLLAILWALRTSSPAMRFGAAWTAITLAPAMGFLYLSYSHFAHDRYMYLPAVGLVLMGAAWTSAIKWRTPYSVLACVIVALLAWETHITLPVWRDDISLFERANQTAPQNPIIKSSLAFFYLQAGRYSESHRLLQQTIQIAPGFPTAYYLMSKYYEAVGDYYQAQRFFTICERLKQDR